MPGSPTETVFDQSAEYTAAAQTIAAQLTEVAPTQTSTAVVNTPELLITVATTYTPTPTSAPTATVTPEPSATSQSQPSPTSTPQPDDPVSGLGEPDWRDRFKNSGNWSLYDDDHVNFSIDDDLLSMVAYTGNGRDSWMLTWPQPEDFYLEASFQPQSCSGLDRYGLILRSDASTGYLAGLSCDGQVSLRRWNGEKFTALINWTTASPALVWANQPNRLGIMVIGDTMTLYVNGVKAGEASDDEFTEGGFGVFIGSKNTENFQVDVLEISYWDISR